MLMVASRAEYSELRMANITCTSGIALLLACSLLGQSRADCIPDQDDEFTQLKKQQFSIETTWIVFNTVSSQTNETNMDGYTLEHKIQRGLNETIDGKQVTVFVNVTGRNKFKEVDTVSFEATFSTDEKPASRGAALSADLLRTLSNLVDCYQEYKSVSREPDQYCELIPAKGLLVTNSDTDSSAVVGSVRLRLDSYAIGKADNRCERVCNQITSSSQDFAKIGKELYGKIYQAIVFVVSLLDPHHWLALVVSIWLATCFFIAMFIKRRDKRRLRLYLEERADYSFSAKKKDST